MPVSAAYAQELADARAATGLDESVLTGEGRIFGRRVAVVVCEFGFLGGSIGVAAAERITAAVQRATAEGLPLLASPSSGGTRMQEGTVAFLQMVKIAAAVRLHKQAHLPYLVYLRNPTTGGVFASWGSLGHVTVAEPGALIGFLGPRVYQQLYGEPFPEGVQTAENLQRHGVIDGVVPLDELRRTLDRAMTVIADAPEPLASRRGTRWSPRDGRTARVVAAARRHRPRAVVGDRPGRGGDHAVGAGPVCRPARGGARPAAPDRRVGGPRVAARGPPRHGPGRGTAAAAGAGDRHRGAGVVGRGRTGRAGRPDRPVSGRAGHPGHPDGVGAAGAGQRRAGAGDGARRCTGGWPRCRRRAPARSSSAIPTTRRNWLRHKASGRAICWRRASST